MSESETIIDRLMQFYNTRSLRELAQVTGVSYNTLRNYVGGESLPSAEVLRQIAATSAVSINWLLTGEGDAIAGGTGPTQGGLFSSFSTRRFENSLPQHSSSLLNWGGTAPSAPRVKVLNVTIPEMTIKVTVTEEEDRVEQKDEKSHAYLNYLIGGSKIKSTLISPTGEGETDLLMKTAIDEALKAVISKGFQEYLEEAKAKGNVINTDQGDIVVSVPDGKPLPPADATVTINTKKQR